MDILVFGDSITQGFYDTEVGGWCNQLAAHVNKKALDADFEIDVSVFNLGISGDCTNRLLKRFSTEADVRTKEGSKTSTIVFAIGINDTQRYVETGEVKTSIEQFKENLELLRQEALKFTNKIIFAGIAPIIEEMVQPMPWADDRSHFMKDIKEYDEAVRLFCIERNCIFIPMSDVYEGCDLHSVLIDGIHPNIEGHKLLYERVRSTLEKEKIYD